MRPRAIMAMLATAMLFPAAAGAQDFVPAPTSPEPGGASPTDLVTGDFNGDGDPDLAILEGIGRVQIALGSSAGDFVAPATSPETLAPLTGTYLGGDLAVGRFNSDASLDLAVTQESTTDAHVTVLLGNGAGDFAAAASSPEMATGAAAQEVAPGDLNNDGIDDLVVAGGGSIEALLASASGDFTASGSPLPTDCDNGDVAIGKLNSDANLDIAVSEAPVCGPPTRSAVAIFLGNGAGGSSGGSHPVVHTECDCVHEIYVSDLNGDGVGDLVVPSSVGAPPPETYVMLNSGAGAFSAASSSPEAGWFAGAVADFSGDGRPDLSAPESVRDSVRVLAGAGNGDFAGSSGQSANLVVEQAPADVDGDTDVDLAVIVSNGIAILLNQRLAPGGGGGGGGGSDSDPPETTITKGPKKKLTKSKAKVAFSSNEAGSSFECQLKGKNVKKKLKAFRPCSSPTKLKKLKPGKKKFAVRAIDPTGNVDPTPAKKKFKRKPPK